MEPLTIVFAGSVSAFLAIVLLVWWTTQGEQCPACGRRRTLKTKSMGEGAGRMCEVCGWDSDAQAASEAEIIAAQRVAAAQALEKQRQAEERHALRMRQRQGLQAMIALVKPVIKADRQVATAEKKLLIRWAAQVYPAVATDEEVLHWLDTLDATDTPDAYLEQIDARHHAAIVQCVEELAEIDGKATGNEKKLIARLKGAIERA